MARRLGLATDAYEQAAGFMLANARTDWRALFRGSVPYLMLAGVVHAGWQMARAALACVEGVAEGQATDLHRQKFATAVYYAAHILPLAHSPSSATQEGWLANRYGSTLIVS